MPFSDVKGGQPDHVVIGRIVKTQGVGGEVKVKPLTDHPPRFKLLESVLLERRGAETLRLRISRVSLRGPFVYLRFEGIDSREAATSLVGGLLMVGREEVLPLEADRFYGFELQGFRVKTTDGREVGRVRDVLDLPANPVFVVEKGEQEVLIPVIRDVVRRIDKTKREIVIQPLEGLLS